MANYGWKWSLFLFFGCSRDPGCLYRKQWRRKTCWRRTVNFDWLKLRANGRNVVAHCWPIVGQLLPKLKVWPVSNIAQQLPTTRNNMQHGQQGLQTDAILLASTPKILLRTFAHSWKFDRFQNLRNNSQQYVTTCNRVSRACKRTQHVTSNNVGSCWPTVLVKIYIFPTVKLALLLLFYSFNNVVSGVCTVLKIVAWVFGEWTNSTAIARSGKFCHLFAHWNTTWYCFYPISPNARVKMEGTVNRVYWDRKNDCTHG